MALYLLNKNWLYIVQSANSIGETNTVFSIIEGILYIVRRNETDDDHLLMVPRNMREDILESCRGNIMAGHLSSRKSLQLLARQFYWWGMARDCDLFVKGCTECNRSKKANRHYKTQA